MGMPSTSANICAVVMARFAGLLTKHPMPGELASKRAAIVGASRKPRALNGRSKSLSSKLQSDFACLTMYNSLDIASPFNEKESRNNHAFRLFSSEVG